MRSKKIIIQHVFVLGLLLVMSEMLIAQTYVAKSGSVFFEAKMTLNSYMGKSIQLQGNIDFETGLFEFNVPVRSIKTGITKRDKDMYELLKEEENPMVVFKGKLIKDFDPDVETSQVLQAKGNFTLAGTTREVIIGIELSTDKEGIRLSSRWSLLITDYKLKRPSKVIFRVNDKHDLGVDALLVKE